MFRPLILTTHRETRREAKSAIKEIVPFILFNSKPLVNMSVFGDALYYDNLNMRDYDLENITIEKYTKYTIKELYDIDYITFANLTIEKQNLLIANRVGVMDIKSAAMNKVSDDLNKLKEDLDKGRV